MNATYQITKADYTEVERVTRKTMSGTYVKYRSSSGKIEEVWVEQSCTFETVPTGIKIERFFTGENTGRGFRIFVTPQNTGTVEMIDARVAA